MNYPPIYLASASPRRQELLRQVGVAFEVIVTDIPETPAAGESARAYVLRLACAKAKAGAQLLRARHAPSRPILGADTEVVVDGEILGKPTDAAHGQAMLRRLAGRTHDVLSAIALVTDSGVHTALSESHVTMAPLTDADIEAYWHTGEPVDKAGGYAIQGWAAAFIERIDGSYSGVVGLPLYELGRLLARLG